MNYPQLLQKKNMLVVILNLDVVPLLPEKTQWVAIQDYVNIVQQNELSDNAMQITEQMFPSLAQMTHRGVNLYTPTATSRNIHTVIRAGLLTAPALTSLLEKYPCDKIHLFTELRNTSYGDLSSTYETSFIYGIIAYQAAKLCIPVAWLKAPEAVDHHTQIVRHIAEQTWLNIDSPCDLITKLPKPVIPRLPDKIPRLPDKPCIISLGHGIEIEQALLQLALTQDPDFFFLHLSFENGSLYEHSESALKIDFRLFRTWPHFSKDFEQELAKAITEEKKNCTLANSYPYIFANPFLNFQFDWLISYIKENYKIVESLYMLHDIFKPRLCITGSTEGFSPIRTASTALHTWGIPRMNIQHGGIWFQYHLHHLPQAEYLAVRGQQIAEDLQVTYPPPREFQVKVVGDFRKNSDEMNNIETHKNDISKEKPVIALLTSQISNTMSVIEANSQRHYESWLQIGELAKKRTDLQFIIKTHPVYDYFNFYNWLSTQYPIRVLSKQTALKDICTLADIAASVNNITSSIIELSSAGIPCILFSPALYHESKLIQNSLFQYIPLTKNIHDFETILDQWIKNPLIYKERIQTGKNVAKLWSKFTGEEAVSTAKQWIEQIQLTSGSIYNESEYSDWLQHILQIASIKQIQNNAQRHQSIRVISEHLSQAYSKPLEKKLISDYLSLVQLF